MAEPQDSSSQQPEPIPGQISMILYPGFVLLLGLILGRADFGWLGSSTEDDWAGWLTGLTSAAIVILVLTLGITAIVAKTSALENREKASLNWMAGVFLSGAMIALLTMFLTYKLNDVETPWVDWVLAVAILVVGSLLLISLLRWSRDPESGESSD